MADKKFTLFELHFDEGFQVGPEVIGLGGDEEETTEEQGEPDVSEESEAESEASESSRLAAVLAFVVLVAVAVAVRRFLGDEESEDLEQEELEEFETA